MLKQQPEVNSVLREKDQERLMVDVANQMFSKKVLKAMEQGQETTLNSTQSIFLRAIAPMADRIAAEIKSALSPQPGMKKLHWLSLKDDDPKALAAIICQEVINVGSYGSKAVDIETRIVRRIQQQRGWREFEANEANKGYFKQMKKYLKQATGGNYKRSKMTQAAISAGVDFKSHKLEMGVGAMLLKLFILETGIAMEYEVAKPGKKGYKKDIFVKFTPKVKEVLAKRQGQFGEFFPERMPMLCEPSPWTTLSDGGYLCSSLTGSLIRSATEEYKREVDVNSIKPMLDGVNSIQDTGFRVNQRVHVLADYLFYHKEQGNNNTSTLPEPAVRQGQPADLEEHPTAKPWMSPEEYKAAKHQYNQEHSLEAKRFSQKQRAKYKAYEEEVSKWEATKNALKVATIMNNMPGLKYRLDQSFLKMTEGEYLEPEDAFFFPISCDFRGRNYAVSKHLNLLGNSLQKGLLEFAEPVAVGNNGVYWLKVALANALGNSPLGDEKLDKLSFDDRVKWVDKHYEYIMQSADSYEFHLTDSGEFIPPSFEYTNFFENADSPWEFIALAFELTDYWRLPSPEFESHAIVFLDAAQSGIQHLAGLTLDEDAAKFTNIVPSDKPFDMYGKVATEVEANIQKKLSEDIPFALSCKANEKNGFYEVYAEINLFAQEAKPFRCAIYRAESMAEAEEYMNSGAFKPSDIFGRWAGNVDRKIVKKSVMTKVYNSKLYRQNIFIEEFLDKQIKSGKFKTDDGHNTDVLGFEIRPEEMNPLRWACVRYLTTEIWHTIDSVVEGPARIMAWFNDVSNLITKEGKFIYWTSPIGLTVSQSTPKYRNPEQIVVDLKIQQINGIPASPNQRIRRKGNHPTDKVKVEESTRAFSPNFVHSLDAAMLLETVNISKKKGVDNFALIHDAYGTSPAHVDKLIESAKEAYSGIYSQDVLGRLYQELQEQTDIDLPEPPVKGKLNVADVINSDYFIA